jgi:hypothetical protein
VHRREQSACCNPGVNPASGIPAPRAKGSRQNKRRQRCGAIREGDMVAMAIGVTMMVPEHSGKELNEIIV